MNKWYKIVKFVDIVKNNLVQINGRYISYGWLFFIFDELIVKYNFRKLYKS